MLFRRAVLFALAALCFGLAVPAAHATQPNPEHEVTLCHRTDSRKNPYVLITVDVASVLGKHGHDGHNGPIFSPALPKHVKWGDIIPPFNYGPKEIYAGKNWPAGKPILDNGCRLPSPPTTTTEVTTTTGCEDCQTTTTTLPQETTTTQAEETTTTIAATTTQPSETTTTERTQGLGHVTTTTAEAVPVNAGPPPAQPQVLAFTGTSAVPLTILGSSFLIAGLLLSRRRRIV